MLASIQRIDWRTVDLRALAEPLAILSPIALIVSGQEFVMSCVALLFLAQSWRARDFSWAREGWFSALLVLWAYALLRTLVNHPTPTGVLVGLHWIHFGIYAAALARWILPDPRTRNRLLYATGIAATFLACDTLLQYVVGYDIIGRPGSSMRLTSVFPKPIVGIEIAWLYLPVVLALWQRGKAIWAAAFGCLCAAAVLLSGDRMGLIDFVASGLFAALLTPALRKPLLVFLPIVAAIAATLLIFNPSMYQRQVVSTLEVIEHIDQSHYGLVFKNGLTIARDHPIFGVGVHRFQEVCLDERYGPPLVGPAQLPRCQGHPHNIYLQWLDEAGGIGLAAYLAFVALTFATILRVARVNAGDAIFHGLAAALVLRFWPLSAGTSFYSTWSAAPMFLMLGWILSYCPVVGRRRAREAWSPAAPEAATENLHVS